MCPVDGIGGATKRQVRNFVKAHKGTVFNASDFRAVAQAMNTHVKVFEMKHEENRNESLKMHSVFEKAIPLENITKIHCIYMHHNNMIGTLLRNKAEHESQSISQTQRRKVAPENIKLGTFLLVKCLWKKQVFRYAVTAQSGVEKDSEIKVMFLRKKKK